MVVALKLYSVVYLRTLKHSSKTLKHVAAGHTVDVSVFIRIGVDDDKIIYINAPKYIYTLIVYRIGCEVSHLSRD